MSIENITPSKRVHETHEMRLEERFVTLFEDEVEEMLIRKEDIKKLDAMDKEAAKEIEEAARSYNRVFSKHFYEVAKGRVSDEEFFPIWEREDELMSGLTKMQMLEGEKRQLKKEVDIAQDESDQLVEALNKSREQTANRRFIFVSYFFMGLVAAVLGLVATLLYGVSLAEGIWYVMGTVVVVALILLGLWKLQKKSSDNVRLYGRMLKQRKGAEGRMGSDYMLLEDDLLYYREKYEVFFGYISEEQWKLFEFCAKVSAEIKFNEEIQEEQENLEKLLETHGLQRPKAWLYQPKVLYDIQKRIALVEELNDRQNVCEQAMVKHRRVLDQYENGEQ